MCLPFSLLFGCGLFILLFTTNRPIGQWFTTATASRPRSAKVFLFFLCVDRSLVHPPPGYLFIQRLTNTKSPFSSSLPFFFPPLRPLFVCLFVHFPSLLFPLSPLQLTTLFSTLLIPFFVCCISSTLSLTNYIQQPPCQPLKSST